MNKLLVSTGALMSVLFLGGCQSSQEKAITHPSNGGKTTIKAKPLAYSKQRQLVMQPLDSLGRAVDSHIQVSKSQLPTNERSSRLNYNPSGWHNYRIRDSNGKKYWAYNRGHLVGYQFCGLNDEPRNLITETRTANAGASVGMDEDNPKSQLYYEQRLREYINSHPSERLDYQVTPLYKHNELMPRSIRLSFVAYDRKGTLKKIRLTNNHNYVSYKGKIGQVIIPNIEKGLNINYKTGQAIVIE